MGSRMVLKRSSDTDKASVINHIPEDRFLFSVVGTDNDSFFEAIMEHFFEIRYFYKPEGNFIDFDFEDNTNWNSFKGVNVVYLAQDYLNRVCFVGKFEALMKSLFEKGYQVLVPVDIFYIDAYEIQGFHFSHTLQISGMGKDGEYYYCQDFFKGKYKMERIPKNNLLQAVSNYWKTRYRNAMGQENCTGLAALKRKAEFVYSFRPRIFVNRFRDMLNMEYDLETPSYGMGIFDAIIETHINHAVCWRPSATKKFYEFIDDNMELMKYRLIYLNEINPVFETKAFLTECEQIRKLCRRNWSRMVQYELSHGRKLIVDKDEETRELAAPLVLLKGKVISLLSGILAAAEPVFLGGLDEK